MKNEVMEESSIIDLDQVSLSFAPGVGVFDLDYSVESGSIFGLIGPSGCGKTTSVRLMLGLFRPDEGQVHVLGRNIHDLDRPVREQIGYSPQHFVLYPELTVSENLRFVASLYGIGLRKRQKRINDMLTLVELSDERTRLAKDLSGGMRKRLELAAALLHQPKLVFADEPTGGIDPVLRGKIWEYIHSYREAGNTLFITTQYVDEASYCDLVGIMFQGRMIHIDTPVNLRRTAMGGDVIDMIMDPVYIDKSLSLLREHPGINKVERDQERSDSVRIIVDEAGKRMPEIFELFKQHPEIKVFNADSYEPPFDTVFRALIEKESDNAGV
jgi:ABC-2 type transport system ATP-binding protein